MWRDAHNIHQWASSFLPSKTFVLDGDSFEKLVVKSSEPWLIDFMESEWRDVCVRDVRERDVREGRV